MTADELESSSRLVAARDWLGLIRFFATRQEEARRTYELSWNLGWAYFKSEDFANAAAWLECAARFKPADPSTRWVLGEALSAINDHDKAEYQLLLSLALKDTYFARRALGFLCHRTGRLELAEAIYLEGIRLRPDDGRRLGAYADFLSDIGREKDAQDYYQRAEAAPKPDADKS